MKLSTALQKLRNELPLISLCLSALKFFSLSSGERDGVRASRKLPAWLLLFVCFACFAGHLPAADFQITGYVTITNTPAGNTTNLVVNIGTSTTRTFTNNAALAPSTTIQTTNSTASTATNILSQVSLYPVYSVGSTGPRLLVTLSSTNTSALEFTAPRNTNITVTFGGNWATVYYVTSTYAAASPILNQTNAMSAEARTNSVNAIVNFLAATNVVPSNSIPPGAKSLQHYTDNVSAQTVSNKTFTGPVISGGRFNNITNATGTNVAFTNVVLRFVAATGVTDLSGFITALTNGSLYSNFIAHARTTNAILDNATSTNLINYGAAFSSPSSAGGEQFGSGAAAMGLYSTAVGVSSIASNVQDTAFGYGALADGQFSTAIGAAAIATNGAATAIGNAALAYSANSVAIGKGASVGADAQYGIAIGSGTTGAKTTNGNGIAIGAVAVAGNTNTVAIGRSARAIHSNSMVFATFTESTAADQVTIGGSGQITRIAGSLSVEGTSTNNTWRGTNVLNGRLDLTSRANTSLANGYNSGVIFGTNAYVRFSGPSAAYTNAGFAAPGGPQFVHAQFDNPGLSFTLLDQSGIEATAANRILTGTGALLNSTNNPVMATFLYDDTASRWRILSFR